MFAEFTRKSGTKLTVNSDFIVYIAPGEGGTTIMFPSGSVQLVVEDYGTVVSKLTGRFTRRAAAGVGQ